MGQEGVHRSWRDCCYLISQPPGIWGCIHRWVGIDWVMIMVPILSGDFWMMFRLWDGVCFGYMYFEEIFG